MMIFALYFCHQAPSTIPLIQNLSVPIAGSSVAYSKFCCGDAQQRLEKTSASPSQITTPTHKKGPVGLDETLAVAFQPGCQKTELILILPPIRGKRLFLRDAQIASKLPVGQHISLVIGSTLCIDENGNAPINIYANHGTLKAEITRNSRAGSGEVNLIIKGSYVDFASR